METTQAKPKKVHVSLSITKEAQDILFDWGYASERTVGAFVSELIVDYHRQRKKKRTTKDIAADLRALVDELERGGR